MTDANYSKYIQHTCITPGKRRGNISLPAQQPDSREAGAPLLAAPLQSPVVDLSKSLASLKVLITFVGLIVFDDDLFHLFPGSSLDLGVSCEVQDTPKKTNKKQETPGDCHHA